MNRVTLCMAYYLNPGMLRKQYERLQALPKDLAGRISLSLVDDGSPQSPAWVEPAVSRVILQRITVDVRWNQDAARNLAAAAAPDTWLLLTDIDHLIPEATWRRVICGPLSKGTVYRFSRVNFPNLDAYKPHPNSWLMTAAMFERIGGYDERFAGLYGTDADFAERVRMNAPLVLLKEVIERVPRDVIPDASTTTYERKAPTDRPGIIAVKDERRKLLDWKPLRGTFPSERVGEWSC
jgi:hypothetical protein